MTEKNATGATLHTLFKEIFNLQSTLSEVVDEVHEKAGMRTSQVRLANTLLELGQATVPDIAYAMKISRQFVQTAINELEKQNMIEFQENPRHKRSKLLKLTEHGRDVLNQVRENEENIIQKILPDMEATRVKAAYELLASIRVKINNKNA
ncbi:MarR family winged helix-turn-helix transcriptional regulator [Maridesulfovibrio ferrireducens]|uniref:MarR family winged helix-turn-helix transcriptional regulator n=1 Tax=Maridesulfovibrio ferrireducens TaxID=246191 RepID=UPI001A253D09|nr:MarR family transcriptional regulator [Maridesulfovibrio ferrireducens]MBI9111555.1 MarR family transcriptional regulator [Maridesulfovibrio ferrireducens]